MPRATARPSVSAEGPDRLSPAATQTFFARLAAANPAPRTELTYANPFTLLIAVLLSAQATDVSVNRATVSLFEKAPSSEAMLALGEEAVRDHIKTIGLFRNKAKNVIAVSRILIEQHGGEVPRSREALESLPGVGRKTANVVLNAVDTHVFRVANRTGLAPGATPLEVEEGLLAVVPEAYRHGAHHWLILHGRYVCKARRPDCAACVVNDLCQYPAKTI
jgi:endonuclease III